MCTESETDEFYIASILIFSRPEYDPDLLVCVQSGTARDQAFLRSAGRLFLGTLNSSKTLPVKMMALSQRLPGSLQTPFSMTMFPIVVWLTMTTG